MKEKLKSLLALSKFTPCGSQTLSKMACRFPANYPPLLDHGSGGIVWDEEGESYIDLISGLGAISVGYSDAAINEAISNQLYEGVIFSLPNKLEYFAAKRLTELVPWTEMWKFGKNGTDGTVMAVRAARAFTGRTKILTIGYNGCADQFEIRGTRTAGIPDVLSPTIVKAEYNDWDRLYEALQTRQYACLLMEPMVYDYPKGPLLKALQTACSTYGTLFILDEVVTGGRFEGFTASRYFDVTPDFIVLSKGIANGLPLCAVGGRRDVMATFERDDFFASGTFGGECASLAAFMETSAILERSIPRMILNGRRIQESFNKLPWGDASCEGYPTRLCFKFGTSLRKAIFMQEMCRWGVLTGQANFVMASHTEDDITNIIEAIFMSYKSMKAGIVLEGPMPADVMRKV